MKPSKEKWERLRKLLADDVGDFAGLSRELQDCIINTLIVSLASKKEDRRGA